MSKCCELIFPTLEPCKLPEWQHNYRRMVDDGHITVLQMIKLMILDKRGCTIEVIWTPHAYQSPITKEVFTAPIEIRDIIIHSSPFATGPGVYFEK